MYFLHWKVINVCLNKCLNQSYDKAETYREDKSSYFVMFGFTARLYNLSHRTLKQE
jgi:hypothetical protein